MRVATPTFTSNLLTELNKLNQQQSKLTQQLGQQSKLVQARDNPLDVGEVVELQSRERAMSSYRQNLTRGELVADISKLSAGLLNSSLKEALNVVNIESTTLQNAELMKGNIRLLNTLIEQALEGANATHDGSYLFSGSTLTTEPVGVSRDNNGDTTIQLGNIRQDVGDRPPTLINGNLYRIENANGVDFTTAGASANVAGEIFEYNGQAIDWIPGSGAGLTAIAKNLTEADKDKLVVGQAYEIVNRGTSTEMRNMGASSNAVGTQFIYNGQEALSWDGAELAQLELDTNEFITEQDLEAYEFYRIVSGEANAFISNSVQSIITDTFQYNGEPLTDADQKAEAVKLNGTVSEGDKEKLVTGRLYQIVTQTGSFTGGGAPAGAQVGDVFTYDGSNITDFGGATLVKVAQSQTELFNAATPGPLVDGRHYMINNVGGDNFSSLSTPANAGTIGTVFKYDASGTPAPAFGATGELIPIDSNFASTDLAVTDIGSAFIVVGGNGTLTGGGSGINAQAGTRFVFDGTPFVPADLGGATLARLHDDPDAQVLSKDKLYKIGEAKPGGDELPNVTKGDSLVAGKTYRIESLGSSTDLTGTGASATPQVGDLFVATGTQPPSFDGAEFKSLVLQTVDHLEGIQLEAGRSYQITATTSATQQIIRTSNVENLVVGVEYEITNNGSDADFSSIGGVSQPDEGSVFTTPASLAGLSPLFGNAVLVEVDGNNNAVTGTSITDINDLQVNTKYQVVDNGSSLDATLAGAPNNNKGTKFVYNGVAPSLGTGELSSPIPATDFTGVGAPNNTVGTSFTATGEFPEWGNGGKLQLYRPERTSETDFTDIGAGSNKSGTNFAYNGSAPVFDNQNDAGGTLFGYKRVVMAAEYRGSSTAAAQFTVAENVTLSPYADVDDNARFADVVNSMIRMREAFQIAANAAEAGTNDAVTRFIAEEKFSEAAKMLDDAKTDIDITIANLNMKQMAFDAAARKDNNLHKNINDLIDTKKNINEAELITQLNQSYSAFEGALLAGSRIGSLNLFDFI